MHAEFTKIIYVAEVLVGCKHTFALARFQVREPLKRLRAVAAQGRRSFTIVPASSGQGTTRKSEPDPNTVA